MQQVQVERERGEEDSGGIGLGHRGHGMIIGEHGMCRPALLLLPLVVVLLPPSISCHGVHHLRAHRIALSPGVLRECV
jgi:hypothetical protein